MELSAVVLARTIGLIETALLNPRGAVARGKFVSLLQDRFAFEAIPSSVEEFQGENGAVFKAGYFQGRSIDELAIYKDGFKIDVRSSTEDGQGILLDTLEFLRREAGITYTGGMIPRWAFLSQIVVKTDLDFNRINPAIRRLQERVSEVVNRRTGEKFSYRINAFTVDFPKLTAEAPIAHFSFERRAKTPDSENLYFSQAPMQTEQHIEILQEFEWNMKSSL